MASLNLSSDGPAINRSYKSLVDAPPPIGAAASSPTYGQWALYTVSAPLLSAFQQESGKESVLKVQSTGEGELIDLIDDFSDGRIQFAFVRVKDPNTTLPKSVLIAWCGEGVPERTKGYFTSHLSAVSKLLHGYHVQVTARSDRDLTPEGIIRKVADASGSKYSGDSTAASSSAGPPPPTASKPVFTPTSVGGSSRSFNPLSSRSRASVPEDRSPGEDGWGSDAPQVTRTQLEKVAPAYRPTKVNMAELTSQKSEPSRFEAPSNGMSSTTSDIVRGGYQPIGKVDIAALRRQAQESGKDDRPTTVKGAYEPVGKVDIAAIRARAQPSAGASSPSAAPVSPARTGGSSTFPETDDTPKSLADRSAAFTQSERITSMPKPKVANRFGSNTSSFTGTKAPTPVGFGGVTAPSAAPIGAVSKNFADEGGKTPAQIWAEKKARQRGSSGATDMSRPAPTAAPITSQPSGEWDGGYSGKKWATVQMARTGQSSTSTVDRQTTGEDVTSGEAPPEEPASPTGNVSSIRDRFKNSAPMGRPTDAMPGSFDEEEEEAPPAPPRTNLSSKPNAGAARGVPLPGLPRRQPDDEDEEQVPDEEYSRMPSPPARPPRTPTPPTPTPSSPIRIAMPVARSRAVEMEAPEERFSPPTMPTHSLHDNIDSARDMEDEPTVGAHDPARGASQAAAISSFGAGAVGGAAVGSGAGGQRALVQFDYDRAEDNELELKEGEYVTNIEMIDEDWWMGENPRGEKGLFPSNYVEIVEGGDDDEPRTAAVSAPPPAPAAPAANAKSNGPTATAQFDYEATEDNELSFPDGAKITSLEFPDEDWWLGEYNGQKGLFPANYVVLDE